MHGSDVLLVGGYGFIGQALALALQNEHVSVELIGRQDIGELPHALVRCETVVHLASNTTPGSSANNPELEVPNINLTQRIVDLMRPLSRRHLIYFSSGGTVYGNPTQLPVAETATLAPLSPYGRAKVKQEQLCLALGEHAHAVTVLRPSNAYGPGQGARPGFGLVRTLLEHARLGTEMQIWGDGECVRDYIYIDDLVDVTLQLIARRDKAGIYNVGSGLGHSVKHVVDLAEQVTSRPIATKFHPARGTDVQAVVLDGHCLAARMGCRPAVQLQQGMQQTWQACL